MALCEETIYQIALTRIKGMNLLLAKTLLDTIGSASEIFKEKGQKIKKGAQRKTGEPLSALVCWSNTG